MVFIARQGTLVAGHPHVTPFYTPMYRLPTPGCKGWQHGGVYGIICLFLLKKRGLLWNEEPYFANLIPIIFVFTFVYSIILYAFSKVTEGNMLVSNHMIKTSCFRSDRGSDRGKPPVSPSLTIEYQ